MNLFDITKGTEEYYDFLDTWVKLLQIEEITPLEAEYACLKSLTQKSITPHVFIKFAKDYRANKADKTKEERKTQEWNFLKRKRDEAQEKEETSHRKMADMTMTQVEEYIIDLKKLYRRKWVDENTGLVYNINDETLLPLWRDEANPDVNYCNFKMKLKDSLQVVEDVYRWRYGEHVRKYKGKEAFDNLPTKYKTCPCGNLEDTFKRPPKEEKKSEHEKDTEMCQKKNELDKLIEQYQLEISQNALNSSVVEKKHDEVDGDKGEIKKV